MYKLKYFSEFKDINEVSYRIEIYIDLPQNILPPRIQLLLSGDPIKIEYEGDNDIYKPLKQSSCSINVFTNDVLSDLYTGELNKVKLKVIKEPENKLIWTGYLTPNIYSSTYDGEYDKLTLEFIDCIAQLENTKFSKVNTLTTFFEILTRVFDKVDVDKTIQHIYLHKCITLENGSNDLLNEMFIQERNFYDEEDEDPQTNKSVIEDVVRFLGMSLFQFEDKFFLIDYDALKSGNFNFLDYNRVDNSVTDVVYNIPDMEVYDIGVSESNANISLGDVYNKVSVIANTNPIDNTLPDIFDDLTNQNQDPNKYYETVIETETYISAYFNSAKWNTYKPVKVGDNLNFVEIGELNNVNVEEINTGSFFQKNDSYTTEDGEPSTLSWVDTVTISSASVGTTIFKEKEFKALDTTVDWVIFKGGYFIIDLEYMYSNSLFSVNTYYDTDVIYSNTSFSTKFDNTKFMCKLKIGNYYWTGERWANWEKEYLPNKDLYDNSILGTEYKDGTTLYYYRYKLGEKVYISQEEYNKMKAKDRFYLVHKNDEGDLIYNTWKNLTNQVSYKDNLVDSRDGVLIPLPEIILSGEMTFELYAPNELGTYANYRTDGSAGNNNTWVRCCHIRDLVCIYTNTKHYVDIFEKERNDKDILYSNTINDDYVKEMDDITMRVNSFSDKVGSYSYVIGKNSDGDYIYIEDVNHSSFPEKMKMEEFLITRCVNRYSLPKYFYSNSLNNKDIKPFSILTEKTLNKKFVVNSITYDLRNYSVDVETLEL